MTALRFSGRFIWLITLAAVMAASLAVCASAADVSLDPSQRYYRDAAGNAKFLIGYYGWAAVPDGYFIDHPSRYSVMITSGVPYKINYVRISLGVNHMTSSTTPPSWNGVATPVPFLYVSGKADLNQWDSVFWNGLKAQCQLARDNGVIVHVSIFDGVEIRQQGGESYGYANSFWKPSNQTSAFYANPDFNSNGQIDDSGEFYQTSAFNGNTGIGYYQKRLIDKVATELAAYDNVMLEVGNELMGSDSAWNTAVMAYIKTKTTKLITQENNGGSYNRGTGLQGWSQHNADTPADVKNNVASIVGAGYPAWEDPDGPALSNSNVSPDDLRRAAWYSFVGGAACWGGFTVDYWAGGRGFWTPTVTYYRNVESFIQDSGVHFWDMTPQHSLAGNSSENSCLAKTGSEYLVYVLNDASVTLNLSGATGTAYYRTYDPKTAVLSSQQTVAAGGTATFNKPSGADDWVVHVTSTPAASSWDTLGTQQSIGTGTMPAIATDSAGNIHIIYLSGSGLQYKKFDPAMNQLLSETITSPSGGAYWPHIMCDSSDVPHVIFSEWVDAGMPYVRRVYYTNRIGGSWKAAILALNLPSGEDVWYPRLALWGSYAYIGCQCGNQGEAVGRIDRITNLSGTPTVDRFVHTATRSAIAINGAGQLFAPGRYGPAGAYCQEYDYNLNPVGSLRKFNEGTAGKSGDSTTAWADKNNVVHMVTWAIESNGSFPCNDRCGMVYNNTARRNPDGTYPSCVQGLLTGAAGTGPDGDEPSGWWNDDVAPVIVADAQNTVYVAWRGWSSRGEGLITKVDNSAFTQFCGTDPTCGGTVCTGTEFCSVIGRRRWWNCEMAPAATRGVYVVWDNGGTAYIRSVGVSSGDVTAPGPVTNFAAAAGPNQVNLSWTNPTDSDFAGVRIVYKTSGYPANSSDGTLVYSGTGTSYVHSGLVGQTTYYYAAFAYDAAPNFSTRVTASAWTTSPFCFAEAFTYSDGNLSGKGNWTGTATSQIVVNSGTAKIIGGADNQTVAYPVSCLGSGAMIDIYTNIQTGSGSANTLWGIWFDDPNGNNLARWYGKANTARPRIGGTSTVLPEVSLIGGWNTLRVRINTIANTSEFFLNETSLGTLSHVETGAGDSIGRVMLERIYNSTSDQFVYVDNIAIGPGPLDVIAPGPVTNFTANNQPTQVNLSWTNPTDSDYAGTRIVYKTSGPPSDPFDGTLLYSATGTSCVHTSPPGGNIYYAAYAYDGVTNYSAVARASVTRAVQDCFTEAFTYANGNLNGNNGWSGTATSQIALASQFVSISGGSGAYNAVRSTDCTGSALAVRAKMQKGSGASTIWNLYVYDSSGGDLGKWYGSGTSGRGRVGAGTPTSGVGTLTGGWDDLYAKIDFVANTTQFIFNGVVLGAPTHTGGDTIGSIKIERADSSSATGQYVNLDDISIGLPDITPPTASIGAPSASVTRSGPVSFAVTFGESVFGFSAASDIQVNATGTAAATAAVTGSGAGPYTVTLSNITGAGTLGITVKASACTDVAANANTVSAASGLVTIVASDGSIASARQLANGSHVELCGKALYVKQTGFGYVEEPGRTAGIRVEGVLSGTAGDLVCLSGAMATKSGGERYVLADAMAPSGVGSVDAIGLSNRALLDGIVCGLRVKVWGKVKPGSITGNSYVLTDGSDDAGIRVITSGAPGVSENQFVTVVGAAGLDGVRLVYKE